MDEEERKYMEEDRKKIIAMLVEELGEKLYQVLLEEDRFPHVCLDALTFNIGVLLGGHVSAPYIEEFFEAFPGKVKEVMKTQQERTHKKTSPRKE